MANTQLPIWQIHDGIVNALREGNRLVLIAPTGSGKSTQVPQMLLDAGLAGGKRVVVLQPRRVAARTVAARVAWERSSRLGEEVGYQVRFDDRIHEATRIAFVTEGILLRWLQDDPELTGIGALLFDEFHERNLLSDAALALAKRLQTARPDLKLVVMSATLEGEPVANYLGGAPLLVSDGQMFPVELHYQSHRDQRPVSEQAAGVAADIVGRGLPGDILIFMPGMAEIHSTLNALRAEKTREPVALIPLHGELPPEQQDLAFAANPLRKIIVATNVAETSVTIEGVRHVVDGGLARVARYDPDRGMGTLFLEEISRASADQRKGRAGRTAPGTCHRLWSESAQLNRPEKNTPEIQRGDLAEVVLLLHSLGIRHAAQFDWLDRPDAAAVVRAERLLHILGAIDPQSEKLTDIGRRMLRLPMHPRYSRILVEATRRGCVRPAALCAALMSGRDLLTRVGRDDRQVAEARELFESGGESDFFRLMLAWRFARKNNFNTETCRRYGIHTRVAREVGQTFDQILQIAEREKLIAAEGRNESETHASEEACLSSDEALQRCILAGFADQLCIRRDKGTLECDLTEGRRGTLMRESAVQEASLFVAAVIREVEGRGNLLTLLGLATAVRRPWLEEMFPQNITARIEHLFDRGHKRVAAVCLMRFLDLVIHHEHQREVDPIASGRCLTDAYAKDLFELPNLDHEVKQFVARVNLVCAAMPGLEFPALDEAAICACLSRAFAGLTLVKEAQAAVLLPEFQRHLAPEQLGWLDELAPPTLAWPDGRKLKLLYPAGNAGANSAFTPPELQIKLHECFPLTQHPCICEGKVPVRLWLCGPDQKRIESTTDWPGFKSAHYPKLRSALQKKYPGIGWL